MRPTLVDTIAYTAFMRGDQEIVEVMAHSDQLYLSSTVLDELLARFAAGTREARNRAELARFLESPRVGILNVTAETADSYALVYAGLRRKGQPIPNQRPLDCRKRPRARHRPAEPRCPFRPGGWPQARPEDGGLSPLNHLPASGAQLRGTSGRAVAGPPPGSSMRAAIDTLRLDRLLVVYPGERRLPLAEDVEAIGLAELVQEGTAQ